METFIVGGREFTCHRMNAMTANRLLLRLQKVVLPVIGSLTGKGDVQDMPLEDAARLLSEHLDESLMDSLVYPLLSESKVFCVEEKCMLNSEAAANRCFTAENLFDLYELIWLVGRYQFSPFVTSVASRFGFQIGHQKG